MSDDDHQSMGDAVDSYVYIDDEGNGVAPEEETSMLMAMGVRGHPSGAANGHAPDGTPTNEDSAPEQQYAEDPADFERERQLAMERLQAAIRGDYVPPADEPLEGDDDDGDEVDAQANVDEEFEEEEDEEGMGGYTYSREATDEDDWVLERIMDRRTIKGGSKGGSDYKDFYDDFGEKQSGMMAAGRIEYMCKWKWYADPTWETREMLEDEGYFKELKAFEDAALKGVGAVASKWSDLRPAAASKPLKSAGDVVVTKKVVETFFGNDIAVTALAGVRPGTISSMFGKVTRMVSYGCCATQPAIDAFLDTYYSLMKTHRPIILFHGTRPGNLHSICMNGLRVPRGYGEVKNGSAYGMGVYCAFTPSTSMVYCGSTAYGSMFMCIGLVSNNDPDVSVVRDYCVVFHRSDLVLPLWLVTYSSAELHTTPTRRVLTSSSLARQSSAMLVTAPNKVVKMSEDEGKALNKVRKANILNINKLAKKIGA